MRRACLKAVRNECAIVGERLEKETVDELLRR